MVEMFIQERDEGGRLPATRTDPVVELDVIVRLDPHELLRSVRGVVGRLCYSGRRKRSRVPWTISSGVGATSGACAMAL